MHKGPLGSNSTILYVVWYSTLMTNTQWPHTKMFSHKAAPLSDGVELFERTDDSSTVDCNLDCNYLDPICLWFWWDQQFRWSTRTSPVVVFFWLVRRVSSRLFCRAAGRRRDDTEPAVIEANVSVAEKNQNEICVPASQSLGEHFWGTSLRSASQLRDTCCVISAKSEWSLIGPSHPL